MQIVRVEDLEDPRLDDYRNIKDSTLARERGRFIVEGRGTLLVLLSRSSFRPDSILLSERTFASMRAELEEQEPACPIFVAPRPILDRIVGFPFHRGCVAVCTRPEPVDPIELARAALDVETAPRLVVLEGLLNLDNLGLVFRNAMALGARAVLLCPRSCDPLYRKVIRISIGGSLCVPFARSEESLPKLLDGLRGAGYQIVALDPGGSSRDIRNLDTTRLGPVALLFGTEGSGLSEAALATADHRVRIDMEPGVDSLNVSVAAGIALSSFRPAGRESQDHPDEDQTEDPIGNSTEEGEA